jgi:SAM-dependent methyltransferase
MTTSIRPWCYRCASCRTWAATLAIGINGADHVNLDEGLRETGLAALREQNNVVILTRLRGLGLREGATLLDVGSAHGWFVRAARDHGLAAEGVEPDDEIATLSAANGVEPRRGFFPDALEDGERFDAITFNDVLEHIPDARAAVETVRDRLNPGGLLSLNIPNSRGAVFRSSIVAAKVGIDSVFNRLWQVGLPSPHVWYFDEAGLTRLVESTGLERAYAGRLASLTRTGLWQRAHADRRPSPVTVASVAAGWAAAPVLNAGRNSDIMHLVFRRRG